MTRIFRDNDQWVEDDGAPGGGEVGSGKLGYLKSLNPVVLLAPQTGSASLPNLMNQGTHDATLNGDAYIGGSSPLGQALVLDGTGDSASIAHNAAINPDDFTALVLFNTTAVGSLITLIESRNGTTDGYRLNVAAAGTLRAQTFSSGAATNSGAGAISANKWHLAAIQHSGTDVQLFLDGAEDLAPTTAVFTPSATDPTGIGSDDDGTSAPLNGSIALVAIFNTALTATQHARIYSDLLR